MARTTVAHTCEICAKTFFVRPYPHPQRFCGRACARMRATRLRYVYDEPLGDRFCARIDRSAGFGPNGDCWQWTGGTVNGYGIFQVTKNANRMKNRMRRGLEVYAHNFSCMIHNGPAPEDKPCACHTCDNRLCVRGDHLFWGSKSDNAIDMCQKGRGRHAGKGEAHHGAKLTESEVREIRRRFEAGEAGRAELATEFGLNRNYIWSILHRDTWKHI